MIRTLEQSSFVLKMRGGRGGVGRGAEGKHRNTGLLGPLTRNTVGGNASWSTCSIKGNINYHFLIKVLSKIHPQFAFRVQKAI